MVENVLTGPPLHHGTTDQGSVIRIAQALNSLNRLKKYKTFRRFAEKITGRE